jgi:hypothetical protein
MASAVVTTSSRGREGEGHGVPQHYLGVSGAGVCAVTAAHTRTAVTVPGQPAGPKPRAAAQRPSRIPRWDRDSRACLESSPARPAADAVVASIEQNPWRIAEHQLHAPSRPIRRARGGRWRDRRRLNTGPLPTQLKGDPCWESPARRCEPTRGCPQCMTGLRSAACTGRKGMPIKAMARPRPARALISV